MIDREHNRVVVADRNAFHFCAIGQHDASGQQQRLGADADERRSNCRRQFVVAVGERHFGAIVRVFAGCGARRAARFIDERFRVPRRC